MSTRRPLAAILAALLVAAACSGGGGGDDQSAESTLPPTTIATATTTPLELGPGQVARDVGVTFQSGHFLVTIGTVVHDAPDQTLYLGVRLQNLAEGWETPSTDVALVLDGQEHYVALGAAPRIPPGMAADLTAEASTGGGDPLAGGIVRWGRADESRTTVSLADGTAEGFGPPRTVPVDAWGQIGKFTVHLVEGRLFADSVRGPRTATGNRVLRLGLDEYTSSGSVVNGFWPADHLRLTWPDGTVVEPLGGSTGRAPLSWTASTGGSVDFEVPADATGDYEVLLAGISRHAFGLLHPELVERVAIPVTIGDVDGGPMLLDDQAGPLPRPLLPVPDGSVDPRPAVAIDLVLEEVNVSGWAFTATRLTWDPATATATLDGRARHLEDVRPRSTGILSAPSQFAPIVALTSGGHVYGGIQSGIPRVTDLEPVEVSYEFSFVDHFDPDDAALLIGENNVAPSILPLGPDAVLPLTPAVPEIGPVIASPITAGNYRVELVGYRFGLPRELDRPPPGQRALELIVDVTAEPVESAGAFGLGFSTRTQLFLTGADGYLQQSDNNDTVFLEPGETARLGGTWYVSERWQPGPLTLTVRSIDEITAITRVDWLEVTFPVELLPIEGTTS